MTLEHQNVFVVEHVCVDVYDVKSVSHLSTDFLFLLAKKNR